MSPRTLASYCGQNSTSAAVVTTRTAPRAGRSRRGGPREEARTRDSGEEKGRDEVAGEDEEEVHAQKPPGHPTDAGVVEQHAHNRQRPQPVEAGAVAPRAGGWLRPGQLPRLGETLPRPGRGSVGRPPRVRGRPPGRQ